MTRRVSMVLAVALVVLSCGKEPVRTNPTPPPVEGGSKLKLIVFGNETCDDCKRDLPDIDAQLANLSENQRKRLEVTLLVPCAGNPCNIKPTQEIADRYKSQLKVAFLAAPDPWRWTTFRKLIPGKTQVPAAAILDEKGETVLQAFTAGSTTFVPSEIVAAVQEKLK